MNPLVRQLKKYGHLTPEIEKEIGSKIKYITKQKGDFFLKQGQIVSSLFLLEKGLVRSFFIKGEKEVNSWFGFEYEFLGSILPLFCDKPSFENIEFLEDSIIFYISSNDLNDLYSKHLTLNIIGRKLAEDYCRVLEERIVSLQTESAEQRYNSLLKKQPDAIQRISLGHIASFLCITQETLSRIRKR